MSLDVRITKPLENNCVQVDVTGKNREPKYYKVPKKYAKSFAENYKKTDKEINRFTNISFALSTVVGALLTNLALKRIVKKPSTILNFGVSTLGGVFACSGTIYATSDHLAEKQNNLLQKHRAEEIHYFA